MNSNGANILPTWVNMANITNDFTFFEQTDEVLTLFKNVVLRLSDSQRIAGREAYAAALKVYDLYKSAAEAGVPGAQESYDKLKVRFDRLGNSGSPVQPNP
jgi:Zn-dependent metalloprotease